jgi:hypothetical protein
MIRETFAFSTSIQALGHICKRHKGSLMRKIENAGERGRTVKGNVLGSGTGENGTPAEYGGGIAFSARMDNVL